MSEKELSSLAYTVLGILMTVSNNCYDASDIISVLREMNMPIDGIDEALTELLDAGRIREVPGLGCYRLVRDEK